MEIKQPFLPPHTHTHTFIFFYLDCWYKGSGKVWAEPRGQGQFADVLVIPQTAGDGLLAQELQAGHPVLDSDNVQCRSRSHQQARIPVTPTNGDDGTLYGEEKDTTLKEHIRSPRYFHSNWPYEFSTDHVTLSLQKLKTVFYCPQKWRRIWTSEIIDNNGWCLYNTFYSQGLKLFTQPG